MDPGGAKSLRWSNRSQLPEGQVPENETVSVIASGDNSSICQPPAGRSTFDDVPAPIAERGILSEAEIEAAVGIVSAPSAGPSSDVAASSGDFCHERGEAITASPSSAAVALQPQASPVMATTGSVAPPSPPPPPPPPAAAEITTERVHTHPIRHDSPATCRSVAAVRNDTGASVEKVVSNRCPSAELGCFKKVDVGNSGNCTGSPSASLGLTAKRSTNEEVPGVAWTGDRAVQTITPLAREPLRELVPASVGGRDRDSSESTVVDEARIATVKCYFRDDDPIFIRRNLNRLQKGTLAELAVGDIVNVARRCREGERNEGGAGSITRVLPKFFYDVKYVVGGTEKGVDGCFLEKTELEGRKRRVATPRCPDCRSFLHECTCDGYLDIAATVVAGVPSSRTESSKPPAPAPLHSKDARSLKRPRSAMDNGSERAQRHPSRRGYACNGMPGDRVAVGRVEQSVEGGSDVRDGNAQKDGQWNMGMEENDEVGGYGGGGGSYRGALVPALIGQHENDSRQLRAEKVLADDLQRRGKTKIDNASGQKENTLKNEGSGNGGRNEGEGEGGCFQELTPNEVESDRHPGSCKEDGGLTHEPTQLEEKSNVDDEEELWTQREKPDVNPPTEDDNQEGDIKAESRVGPELKSAHESGGKEPISEEGGGFTSTQWQPRKGDLVEVERRTSPGLNKLGGTARVVKVDSRTGAVDVRYVVEGGWERGIDPVYVRPAVLDMTQKRPTLGRCSHCGSLRVDCAGRCEFFTRRSSRRPDSEVGAESVAGDQRSERNHRRDSRGSYVDDIELTRRNEERLPRRRRYLQEDWDEEEDLVSRSDGSGHIGVGGNETDRWMEGDSDGSLGDDDLAMGSQKRQSGRRLGKPGDDVDSSTDGEIKLLSVARDRRGSLREGSVGSGSESNDLDPSDSAGEEGSDGGDFGTSSERGGVGSRGWRGSPDHAAEGSAVARFLMPEGEEAARMLPSDIADPTKGIKDPARLRRELKSMLREMEERDANELEQEISKTCRRLASSSRRPSTINREHRELVNELRALAARTTRTLRRLDVANNIFVRLEKLEKRWREGNEGVNAWHRLDGLSNRLEQLRRDANKALREHDCASSDSVDSDSDAGGSSVSDNSSEHFGLESRRQWRANKGRNRPVPNEGGVSAGVRKRSSVSGSSNDESGEKNSMDAGGEAFVNDGRGSSTMKSSGRKRGQEKKRRRRGSSNRHRERRGRGSAPHPGGIKLGDYGWTGRERDVKRDAPYLLGLDYSMAVESDEPGADGNDAWDSEDSSLSSRSPSISPVRWSSQDTVTRSRGDQRSRPGMGGSRGGLRGADGGGGNRVNRVLKDRASGPATSRGVRSEGGASVHRGDILGGVTVAAAAVGRERRRVRRVVTKRRSRPKTEINGRALMEEQYRYRLAQQQARGVPQSSEGYIRGDEIVDGLVLPLVELGSASAQSASARDCPEKDKEGQVGESPTNLPVVPSLVEDLMSMPRASRCSLRFKTLYSQTLDVASVTVDGLTLEVGGVDPCAMIHRMRDHRSKPQSPTIAEFADGEHRRDIPDQSGSSDEYALGGGELIRVLGMLPQRMADLEELARVEGLDGEVHALAKECCELMAVIGAKLRAPCCPRGVLLAVRMVVERLVEACAPGRDTGDSGDRSPGVSLTRVMKIAESLEDSLGSTAFVETCVAFHMHLLEWLAVLEGGFDDTAAVGGPEQAPPSGTSGAGSNKLATSNGSVCKTLSSTVVDFARQLLLDLLFLFEKRFSSGSSGTVPFAARRDEATPGEAMFRPSAPRRHISRDPLSELLSAVMDTLDGIAGDISCVPGPAASVSVPGLARPLVGFWAVFFEIVSGGTAAPPSSDGSWNVGLQSELVWKALIHAFRVSALRHGWNDYAPDDVQGEGESGAPTEALAARRKRRKETSGALWECVRLLLAASPFCEEFRSRDQALAVTMTANATAAARKAGHVGAVASKADPHASVTGGNTSASSGPSQPIVPALEAFSAPGMMARVLLERVLVLARFRAPEAGPRGVIEVLWVGVPRISREMCLERSPYKEMMEASIIPGDRGQGESTGDKRKERRLRAMRKSLFASGVVDGKGRKAPVE